MLLGKGKLGVMPGSKRHYDSIINGYPELIIPPDIATAMLRGEEVYTIEYLTPAMRMFQAELMGGIMNTWKFANDIAQTQPEIYDNLDEDISLKRISEFAGAPQEIIRSAEVIAGIRDARAKQQQQAQEFQQKIETMKALGHLKGLAPQQPAPGVQAEPEMAGNLQL